MDWKRREPISNTANNTTAAGSDGTWVGKGGGRSANQPMLQPADGSNGTWIGRGGGRSPNQPIITRQFGSSTKCF